MTEQAKANELIWLFEPHVNPYLGSGMLTNDYDDIAILYQAKRCAKKHVEQLIKELSEYRLNNDVEDTASENYYYRVMVKIDEMEKLPEIGEK